MPRPARISEGGCCYHVLNRGNGRAEVFLKRGDYDAFVALMGESCERLAMRVLAYCVMPNHFHLVLQPFEDGDLSRWMQWFMTAHVRRYREHYGGCGHIWQDRFKSFPIEADRHLWYVLRYVERNPLRAGLVIEAEAWPWSSLRWWGSPQRPSYLDFGPLDRPGDWVSRVNRADTETELEVIRKSVNRGVPLGSQAWCQQAAIRHGLECSLRQRGRPCKNVSSGDK